MMLVHVPVLSYRDEKLFHALDIDERDRHVQMLEPSEVLRVDGVGRHQLAQGPPVVSGVCCEGHVE